MATLTRAEESERFSICNLEFYVNCARLIGGAIMKGRRGARIIRQYMAVIFRAHCRNTLKELAEGTHSELRCLKNVLAGESSESSECSGCLPSHLQRPCSVCSIFQEKEKEKEREYLRKGPVTFARLHGEISAKDRGTCQSSLPEYTVCTTIRAHTPSALCVQPGGYHRPTLLL